MCILLLLSFGICLDVEKMQQKQRNFRNRVVNANS